jgi:glycerol-3-phosphate cytidylyltransferase-like family protein
MKKGQAFMPAAERVKLVRALDCVDAAVIAVDGSEWTAMQTCWRQKL